MMAYAMSKSKSERQKIIFCDGYHYDVFSGGMIPTYLLFRQIGLLNSFWVYIIPALLSYYDVIILMNFLEMYPIH